MNIKPSIKTMFSNRRVVTSLLLLSAINVHAQTTKPCIELINDAQMEQAYTDAQGKQATRLVALGKVVPGNEVIYTITAKNVCDKPASAVVINNPVPEHMAYVSNSAMGVGTDITYSLDGKSFAKLDALTVKNADGTTRAPHADEIKAIRWIYSTAIDVGQTGFVRFRATVK
jgi:uncharacterized repeat protein (TIGR01451 family)